MDKVGPGRIVLFRAGSGRADRAGLPMARYTDDLIAFPSLQIEQQVRIHDQGGASAPMCRFKPREEGARCGSNPGANAMKKENISPVREASPTLALLCP
ncbi:hypothetical protein VPH35_020456 [Triticum aestivum]